MIHRGIEFSVTEVAAGVWTWRFQLGDRIFTGRTGTNLDLLAIRRVQLRIDRELKKIAHDQPPRGRGNAD
ncbi:hypothetical protein [Bradyrhizobium sp. ORS 86]|uniref:hypothetical protein n=1 Tax=Bradyrhizobium sp. ORS 86 TaxID=1685970 RepID=UPI00388FF103